MMTERSLLDSCASITLADLQQEAAFLTRRDRKYLLPVAEVPGILAIFGDTTRVLEIGGRRTFGYETTYFDNDSYVSYHGALRKRPNRFKVRVRSYLGSDICQLEAKVRDGRGNTVKHRMHHAEPGDRLDEADRRWLEHLPQVAPYADSLAPCLTTMYRRSTLVLPEGAGRITFDRSLAFALPDGTQVSLPGVAIVESKGPGQPLPVDRLLWRHGYRPQSISKYALGLSLLLPELPANRWHRIRRDMQAIAVPVDHVTSQMALTWLPDTSRIDADVPVPPELQAVSLW